MLTIYIIAGILIFIIGYKFYKNDHTLLKDTSFFEAVSCIISFLGIILIVATLKEQIIQNNRQAEQWRNEMQTNQANRFQDYCIQRYDVIKKDFKELRFVDTDGKIYESIVAVSHFGSSQKLLLEESNNIILRQSVFNFENQSIIIMVELLDLLLYVGEHIKEYPREAKFIAKTIKNNLSIYNGLLMKLISNNVNIELRDQAKSIAGGIEDTLKIIEGYPN
ncbi:hypothetical protein [Flavobacterium sp. NRK1]|uniref:hypothetical protein n=1 Tax=Flavobacterium sp. NRK1 TaxID=2954929 RepID=UPI002092719E|nr:hypothetical protein [Flavobacterium sp. NRK1]MCO6148964.1 hypothetical protein [Flavobacterium sp. NRK1]